LCGIDEGVKNRGRGEGVVMKSEGWVVVAEEAVMVGCGGEKR
jgi:hypothetical protein